MVSRLRLSFLCRRPSFCISPTRKVHPSSPSRGSSSTSSRRTTNWGLDENVAGNAEKVQSFTWRSVTELAQRYVWFLSHLRYCGSLRQWSRPSTCLQTGSGSSGPHHRSWACLGSGYRSPAWRTSWWSLNRTSWGTHLSTKNFVWFSHNNFPFPSLSLSLNVCFGDGGDYDYRSMLQHQQNIENITFIVKCKWKVKDDGFTRTLHHQPHGSTLFSHLCWHSSIRWI